MGLVGNMIATAYKGNPAMVNYDMFTATFGMASLLYLLPTSFLDSFHIPIVAIGLDVLNVIFWFCAAVATPAYLHVHSCSNKVRTSVTTSSTVPPRPRRASMLGICCPHLHMLGP